MYDFSLGIQVDVNNIYCRWENTDILAYKQTYTDHDYLFVSACLGLNCEHTLGRDFKKKHFKDCHDYET